MDKLNVKKVKKPMAPFKMPKPINRPPTMGIITLAKQVRMDSIICPKCGKRVDGLDAFRDLLELVLINLKSGFRVRFHGIGTLYAKYMRPRTIKSPLVKGGTDRSRGGAALRFRQAISAKRFINDNEV